ncbi:MAG: nucleotidyltransferase domain-containing protein [Candidatus ainarchaeum sp.]|nr:nucleotidyltransferase domain-containing protein [Candidatus ainarchaeum sp.]
MTKLELDKFLNELKKIQGIISIYLYGSILNPNFDYLKKDIDILIIANEKNQLKLIKKIEKIKNKYSLILILDLGIRFTTEIDKFININRPPTAYFGIAHKNKLVFGKDYLEKIKNIKIMPKDIFIRVCNLAQGCRGIYLSKDEKNSSFWINYQRKWLIVAFLEVLYLDGVFELNKEKGLKLFIKNSSAPKKILNLLDSEKTTLLLLLESSEWLREYLLKNYSSQI